ncbi:MAG: hypothetical protein JWL80_390 [Parcubacteria group bacterium]|nr:hypothetical protein [Parcubacteria group bacterium]
MEVGNKKDPKVGLELRKRGRYTVFLLADGTYSQPFASIETGLVIIERLQNREARTPIDNIEISVLRYRLNRSALSERRNEIDDLIDRATEDGVCNPTLLDDLIDQLR